VEHRPREAVSEKRDAKRLGHPTSLKLNVMRPSGYEAARILLPSAD
jgi:hypothetical protein